MTYKLNIKNDVDKGSGENDYLLWLPYGYRFSDDLVHCLGFDTLAEIKRAAKNDVIDCDCVECASRIKGTKV